MDVARFWQLIDLLQGTVDDTTMPALEAELTEHGESMEFLDLLDERVRRLLEACSVPPSHAGDASEWLAAAVVASGRTSYERALAGGGQLDPDAWAWSEGEDLLVAGFFEPELEADTEDTRLTLQWKSREVPVGVTTEWRPDEDFLGEDPSLGHVPTRDEAWNTAVGLLLADEEFLSRRAAMSGVGLHLVVRDVDEMELSGWPGQDDEPSQISEIVLVAPVAMILAEDSRVQSYLQAVVTMITAAQESLPLG